MSLRTQLFFLFSFLSSLYALETFSITFKGEVLTLTKEIDPAFLGAYISKDRAFRSGFYLDKSLHKSYQIWLDSRRKRFFEWGVLVKNGRIFLSKTKEKDPQKLISRHYVLVRYFYSGNFHIALLSQQKFLDGGKDRFLFDDVFEKDEALKIKE